MQDSRDIYLLWLKLFFSKIFSTVGVENVLEIFDEYSTRELSLLCDFLKEIEYIYRRFECNDDA